MQLRMSGRIRDGSVLLNLFALGSSRDGSTRLGAPWAKIQC